MIQTYITKRPTVKALEEIMYEPISVLDKGIITVVNYQGDDSSIVSSARVSYGEGTRTVSDDKNLIEYLFRHRHTTPVESCEIQFYMKLPIFVARQWIRHRTANVNEYSARYSILRNEFYIPDVNQIAAQSKSNKQGRGETLDPEVVETILESLIQECLHSYNVYELNLDRGLARELARMSLPLNTYTEWFWKIDLHNLFHFLSLRKDKHAQYEIRVYADIISDIVQKWCPLAYDAWLNCSFEAKHFTRRQWEVLKDYYNKGSTSYYNYEQYFQLWNNKNGIGRREFNELFELITDG